MELARLPGYGQLTEYSSHRLGTPLSSARLRSSKLIPAILASNTLHSGVGRLSRTWRPRSCTASRIASAHDGWHRPVRRRARSPKWPSQVATLTVAEANSTIQGLRAALAVRLQERGCEEPSTAALLLRHQESPPGADPLRGNSCGPVASADTVCRPASRPTGGEGQMRRHRPEQRRDTCGRSGHSGAHDPGRAGP
jgi:hypothetical protein